MRATAILFLFITLLSATITTALHHKHHPPRRHLLHQPFFPVTTTVSPTQPPSQIPSLSLSPSPQPEDSPHPQRQLPKYPFSTTPNAPQKPFFPSYPSQPPPPPPSNSFLSSFPANISSLLFPQRPSSTNHSHVLILAVTLSLISVAVISTVSAAFLYFRGRQRHQNLPGKPPRSDSQRLVPPNLPPSDGNLNVQRNVSSNPSTSSEFLYLGTLVNSRSGEITTNNNNPSLKIGITTAPTSYEKLGSPELRPLPPLPKYNPSFTSGEMLFPKDTLKSDSIENQKEEKQLEKEEREYEEEDDDDDEEFFSPRGSSGGKENPQILMFKESPVRVNSSSRRDNFGSRSFNSRTASYPYSNSCSPPDSISSSCHSPATNYSPQIVIKPSLSSSSPRYNSENTPISLDSNSSTRFVSVKLPPPPPPPPPPRFWEAPAVSRPIPGFPELVPPSMPGLVQNVGPTSDNEQMRVKSVNAAEEKIESRPKLKPLHWDKVRTSSDRAMVWDQLKSSSFQLNEEMIETLFMVNNSSNQNLSNDNGRRQSFPTYNHETRVLDPKKSQNIAILLRALNVTVDEVCEALLEGNSDNLGTELLESLLKMAPSKEEEQKIKEFKDESPSKLGPAEKFLKAVLDIPFAFKRVDALLYIANFDSEVDYLKRSFETLKVASEELRNSRMFFKLLDAVLKTGNRMNVGTNRGDAHAFKLDSLLKLVDVKGTDGKTTLLHFVVQEIIRSEGHRVSEADPETKSENTQKSDFQNDLEFRKLGLQVVSGLGGELSNVKKAAAMDSEVLGNEVSKLALGISKIMEVVKLNEDMMMSDTGRKFSESMNGFLTKAKMEIARVQEEENVAVSMVKETSEYFHGNSSKEEAHPFRIFTVVKDFLSILDRVCREVGKINERTIYSSVRPMPVNQMVPPAFPGFNGGHNQDSLYDENSSSS